jgi:urease gamma subunit
MKAKTYILREEQIKGNAIAMLRSLPIEPLLRLSIVEVKSIRSLEQNKKMWSMLGDISKQVEWHGMKLTKENWKDMITAALKGQKVVPGLEGGFVVLGQSTSRMSIKEMIDVIEFAYAFGADPDHPVQWSDPKDEPPW